MKFLGVLLFSLLLGGPVDANVKPGEIVIGNDPGGDVEDYARWIHRIEEAQIPVRFRGACISACTLLLSLPKEQLCVEPKAKFGFHLASIDGKPDVKETRFIMEVYYPRPIINWIMKRWPLTRDVVFMDADEIKSLGVVDACK